jgi:hypothetical protein
MNTTKNIPPNHMVISKSGFNAIRYQILIIPKIGNNLLAFNSSTEYE